MQQAHDDAINSDKKNSESRVSKFMSKAWVGLTEEEFKKIMLDTYNIDLNVPGHFSDDHLLWAAIEAKLREKNNG
jgi:hypothetical protein